MKTKLSFAVLYLAALGCGGKVVFDGVPGGGTGGATSSMSSSSSVAIGSSSQTAVVGSSVSTVGPSTTTAVTTSTTGSGGGGGCLMNDKITFDKGGVCDMCVDANCCPEANNCTQNGNDTQSCVDDDMVLTTCENMCTANDPMCMTMGCMQCEQTCISQSKLAGPLISCVTMHCHVECGI